LDTSKKLFYYNVSENRNNGRKESYRMENDRWKIFAHHPPGPNQDFKSFSKTDHNLGFNIILQAFLGV
jgi:hypothetical protein